MSEDSIATEPAPKFHQRFTAHDGMHQVISVYRADFWKIRKPIAFQVYVTFDTTSNTDTNTDNFIDTLHDLLIPESSGLSSTVRLDIMFLGQVPPEHVASVCTAHYKAARTAHAKDRARRLVPSYTESSGGFEGFLITVPSPDWKVKAGLGFLRFHTDPEGELLAGDHHHVHLVPSLQDLFAWDWRKRIVRAYEGIPSNLRRRWEEEYWLVVEWARQKAAYEWEARHADK